MRTGVRSGLASWMTVRLVTLILSVGTASAAMAQPEGAAAVSDDYQIGPGDTLNVFVWREPELSVTVPVRPDGQISTPLVEDMRAVGKTPSELARDVEEVLSKYIRAPQVTVIVEAFVGTFSSQIRVLGQVVNPGSIAYRDRMTVLDAILEAGGLTQFASGNRTRLSRSEDDEVVEIRVRLKDLIEDGDLGENVRVEPGDVIIVPEAIF